MVTPFVATLHHLDYSNRTLVPHSEDFPQSVDQGSYVLLVVPCGRECICVGAYLPYCAIRTFGNIRKYMVGIGLFGCIPIYVCVSVELYAIVLAICRNLQIC